MEKSSLKSDFEDSGQLDMFEEKDIDSDIHVDNYKDIDLDFVKSTKHKFLTWNAF